MHHQKLIKQRRDIVCTQGGTSVEQWRTCISLSVRIVRDQGTNKENASQRRQDVQNAESLIITRSVGRNKKKKGVPCVWTQGNKRWIIRCRMAHAPTYERYQKRTQDIGFIWDSPKQGQLSIAKDNRTRSNHISLCQ